MRARLLRNQATQKLVASEKDNGSQNFVAKRATQEHIFHQLKAEPHSSMGSVADLRTGGRWFDPWIGQYSFQGLMIVIVTGFIPLALMWVVFEVTLLLEKWKLLCLISTFRVPCRSKNGWRK